MALSRSMKNLMHDAAQARRGGGSHNPNGGGRLGGTMGQYNRGGRMTPRGPMPDRGPRGPVKPGAPSRLSQMTQRLQQQQGGFSGLVAAAGGRNPATGGPGPPQRITKGGLGRRTNPITGGPGLPPRAGPKPRRGMAQIAVPGGRMPRGGVMGGPTGGGMLPGTVGKPMPRGGTFGFASRGGGGTPALQEATAGARSQVMRQAAARPTGLPGAMSGVQQQAAMQRSRAAGLPGAISGAGGKSIAQRISSRQGPPASRGGMARALGTGGSRRRMLR